MAHESLTNVCCAGIQVGIQKCGHEWNHDAFFSKRVEGESTTCWKVEDNGLLKIEGREKRRENG